MPKMKALEIDKIDDVVVEETSPAGKKKKKIANIPQDVDTQREENGAGTTEVAALEHAGQSDVQGLSLVASTEKDEYEHLCQLVNQIAQPLASRKIAKKIYKLIRKANKEKGFLRQGLADVMKAFRKNEKGIVILAGNVSPIDVYSHIPAICEEKEIPYIYTPSREHLGCAAGHRRPAIVLLIKNHESYNDLFEQMSNTLMALVVESV